MHVVVMTPVTESSVMNSRKENIVFGKTEIVLTRKNLAALKYSLEAVKSCFGQDFEMYQATIRKKDKSIDNYTTEGIGEVILGTQTGTFHFAVKLTLEKTPAKNPSGITSFSPIGSVEIRPLGGLYLYNDETLVLCYDEGRFLPTTRARFLLEEYRKRMSDYRKEW